MTATEASNAVTEMIEMLKQKIKAFEEYKTKLESYDRELNEDENCELFGLVMGDPNRAPWTFNNNGTPVFFFSKNDQLKIESCVNSIQVYGEAKIPDYDEM